MAMRDFFGRSATFTVTGVFLASIFLAVSAPQQALAQTAGDPATGGAQAPAQPAPATATQAATAETPALDAAASCVIPATGVASARGAGGFGSSGTT